MRGIIEILVSFLYSDGSQEVWQMKQKDTPYLFRLNKNAGRLYNLLLTLKTALIAQGRYTDAVDDVLCNFSKQSRRRSRYNTYNKSLPIVVYGGSCFEIMIDLVVRICLSCFR